MEYDEEREAFTISTALLGENAYLLGSDVTALMRLWSSQMLDDAHLYVDEGEREAALALGSAAIHLSAEADRLDVNLIEVQNFEPEEGSTVG